ncbi:hypothetical protein Moror_13375 [Moniliophthora roreri MCA 2997]|uniref:SAP domain-containing protein n=1 Tax=Moniliophthora roreri (strain MCA 2997) TaxID=1381753 RepID=V2W2P5_MONRO|nr:hypothetical protein Moror_13375 [Moniliophthora roreri MCA 2997]
METGDVSGEQESETPKGKERISEAEMQRVFDFPGATGDEIEQLKIYTFKNQLKELCSKYGLRKFGNVDMLCTRLVEFSENWDQRSKKPGACRTHKGPQKSKTIEYSTKDTRTKEQKHARVEEAKRYRLAHPEYQTLSEQRQTKNEARSTNISDLLLINRYLDCGRSPCNTSMHQQQARCCCQAAAAPQSNPQYYNPTCDTTSLHQSNDPASQSHTANFNVSLLTHTTTVTQPTASQATVQQTPSASSSSAFGFMQPDLGLTHPDAKWKCIVLYGEEDLDKLGRMWDDKNPDFNEKECLLRIGNPERGVPMKYWGDVLKLESPDPQDNCWEVWKCKLYPWSLIREYYNKVRKSAFWEEFTVDGCKLCQTAIYQDLLKRQPRYRGSR